jgi:hypothetical protein
MLSQKDWAGAGRPERSGRAGVWPAAATAKKEDSAPYSLLIKSTLVGNEDSNDEATESVASTEM